MGRRVKITPKARAKAISPPTQPVSNTPDVEALAKHWPEFEAALQDLSTLRRRRFVLEYLVDQNGTLAARRAGFTGNKATLAAKATALLNNAHVARAVLIGQRAMEQKYHVTIERIIKELAAMATANMQDYITINAHGDPVVDLSKLTRAQAAAIQEVDVHTYVEGRGADKQVVKRVKFKLADKRSAGELLAKMVGLYVERQHHNVEHTGRDGGPIEHTEIGRELTDQERATRLLQILNAVAVEGTGQAADLGPGKVEATSRPAKPRVLQ